MLRRYEAFAHGCSVGLTRSRTLARCAQLGLASLVLLLACAPAALAAPGDPKPAPQELWEAFPLNPTGERLGERQQAARATQPKKPARATQPKKPARATPAAARPVPAGPLLPPTTTTSPQETQAVGQNADPASGTNFALFALVAGLLVFLAAGLVSVRLRAGNARMRSAPLWQGTAGLEVQSDAGAQRHPDVSSRVRQRPRLVRPRVTRRPRARHAVVQRRPSPQALTRTVGRPARRLHDVVWTADTAPAIVGAAIAVVLAILIVRFVG